MNSYHPPILVFISDPILAENFREMLHGTNLDIHLEYNFEEGLKRAEDLLPALILVDNDFTGPSGLEVCRQIRTNSLLAALPLVMITRREDRDSRAAGLSLGVDDFIEKPFDAIELLARVRAFTRLNAYGSLLGELTRFSWIVERAHEGYLLLNDEGSIHYANERAVNLLNLPEDYYDVPYVKVVNRYFLPEPEEVWKNWLDDPEPCFLIQPESPTARVVWVVMEAIDTTLAGTRHRIVRLRDETERMSLYHDMRRFHTVVAHKLRTPVSQIYGTISLLQVRMDALAEADLRMFLKSSINGTERLVNEIREILSYIDSPLAINLGAPMQLEKLPEVVQAANSAIGLKDISLVVPESLASVTLAMTNEAMEVIFIELLDNSRKFHPERNPHVEISVAQMNDSFVMIRVADNGMHLSAEQLSWAWVPYFQGEKDFTGELPGMGLGFPMVATLVWKSGGEIHLRNRQGATGVIVDMRIPLESTMRKVERSAAVYEE